MAVLNNSWENIRLWWQSATPATKAAATGMAVLIVIGLIAAAWLASNPNYVAIYHNVSDKEASEAKKILGDQSIPMEYRDGAISVPAKDEGNATMAIGAANILGKESTIEGIDSLDKIGMGTSTEVERTKINHANEGELERKIDLFDPVQSCAVSITPGSTSSLFSDNTPAAANVILTLKPGVTLSPSQVLGIVNTVAHAVPGLTTHYISIADQSGISLWKDNGAGGNAMGDGQPQDENAKYEQATRKEWQSALDAVYGPGKTILTVTANLDYDETQIDSLEHTPAPGMHTGLPLSTQEKDETYTGNAPKTPGGVAGAGSNLNAPSYTANGSGAGDYKSENTTTNYENDTTHKIIQKSPGSVKRISVGALVDSSVSTADVAKIKEWISVVCGGAMDITPTEAAQYVTVQQVSFDTSLQKAAKAQMQAQMSQQLSMTIIRAVVVCVVVVALVLLLLRSGGKSSSQFTLANPGNAGSNIGFLERASSDEIEELIEERPLRIEDVLAEMPEAEQRPRRTRRALAPSIEEQPDFKLESIQDMISTHPDAVALLLKGWMAEEARIS